MMSVNSTDVRNRIGGWVLVIAVLISGMACPTAMGQGYAQSAVNPANGHVYYRSSTSMSWQSAKSWAAGLGGRLVTINNASEQDWIVASLLPGLSTHHWIGLYQLPGSVEPDGGWVWESGSQSTYRNWGVNQPDVNAPELENHAHLKWNEAWKWNDGPGSSSFYAIAEVAPFTRYYNGHWYTTVGPDTWSECQSKARVLGGDLVTINDTAENQWLVTTFGSTHNYWIGLHQNSSAMLPDEGWSWVSGEPFAFANWKCDAQGCNPNDIDQNEDGEEQYGEMNHVNAGEWNDIHDHSQLGIVEIDPTGSDPDQPDYPDPDPPAGKHVIYVTHGWIPLWSSVGDVTDSITNPNTGVVRAWSRRLVELGNAGVLDANDWQVGFLNWSDHAHTLFPDSAADDAISVGAAFGDNIDIDGVESIHLIAHSAGAHLIEAAARRIRTRRGNADTPRIQTTFLDPYLTMANGPTGMVVSLARLGGGADWSENYYTIFGAATILDFTTVFTGTLLPRAYNLHLDHAYGSWATCIATPIDGFRGTFFGHGWPVEFYAAVVDPDRCSSLPVGWPVLGHRTTEAGTPFWPNSDAWRGPFSFAVESGDESTAQSASTSAVGTKSLETLDLTTLHVELSPDGTVTIAPQRVDFQTVAGGATRVWARFTLVAADPLTWINTQLTWTGPAQAEGVLRAYVNGLEVAVFDQRLDDGTTQDISLRVFDPTDPLAAQAPAGSYELLFVLDSFNAAQAAGVRLEGLKTGLTFFFDADLNSDGLADIEDLYFIHQNPADLDSDGTADQDDRKALEQWIRRFEQADMDWRRP